MVDLTITGKVLLAPDWIVIHMFATARGGKREPQKIPPFRIVEFFGGVVRGMTTRQRLPHLSEALWRDAETPGNSATPVPGPQ